MRNEKCEMRNVNEEMRNGVTRKRRLLNGGRKRLAFLHFTFAFLISHFSFLTSYAQTSDSLIVQTLRDNNIRFSHNNSVTLLLSGQEKFDDMFNAIRQANGIAPFALADTAGLSAAAVRAQDASYYLSHSRPDGSSYITALDEAGVAYCHYPHEVLVAYGDLIETNLGWWMNSPGHSAKLMNPGMDIIAIGHYGGVWVGMIY